MCRYCVSSTNDDDVPCEFFEAQAKVLMEKYIHFDKKEIDNGRSHTISDEE